MPSVFVQATSHEISGGAVGRNRPTVFCLQSPFAGAGAMAEVEKETILTPEGLRKLEDVLEHVKKIRRMEVAERIKQSKEFGELMENSEYEDANNEQVF